MRDTSMIGTMANVLQSLTITSERIPADDGAALQTVRTGRGARPIVFVPGWSLSAEVFEHQFRHFDASPDVTFVSFDPRGQGASTAPETGYGAMDRAGDIARVLNHLGLDGVVLGGWSQGVHDVLAYAERFGTDRLAALVLIDGAPRATGDDNDREWVWYRRDDADGYQRLLTHELIADPDGVMRRFAAWMLEAPDPAAVAWLTGLMRRMTPAVGERSIREGADADFQRALIDTARRLPVLIVVADEKRAVADAWVRANAPAARFAAMGRHLMFWERAEAFNALLDRFLADIAETRG
jgi:non-heme chloroperoxidase